MSTSRTEAIGAVPAHRRSGSCRRLAGWLAVLPFLLFSLVLPGTMLARDAAGGITVVLCSGDAPVEVVMRADGSLVPVTKTPHDARHLCDWTPHGQPLMPGAALGAMPPPALMPRLLRPLEPRAHLHRADVLSAPARGPPALA